MASSDSEPVTVEHYLDRADRGRRVAAYMGEVPSAPPVARRDSEAVAGAVAGYEALGRRIAALEWERDQYRESLHATTRQVEQVESDRARYAEALAMAVHDLRDAQAMADLVWGEGLSLRQMIADRDGLIDQIRELTAPKAVRDIPHLAYAMSLIRQVQRTIRAGHKAGSQ